MMPANDKTRLLFVIAAATLAAIALSCGSSRDDITAGAPAQAQLPVQPEEVTAMSETGPSSEAEAGAHDEALSAKSAAAAKQLPYPERARVKAELFVMSKCVYGQRAEAMLHRIRDILGDRVNVKIRMGCTTRSMDLMKSI